MTFFNKNKKYNEFKKNYENVRLSRKPQNLIKKSIKIKQILEILKKVLVG